MVELVDREYPQLKRSTPRRDSDGKGNQRDQATDREQREDSTEVEDGSALEDDDEIDVSCLLSRLLRI